ncbi:MAG TPA: class A beta-lactamase [Acidobacteriota bacterium]|nr:class A beta-lactamase [Acidobacteriota bacterium]
MKTLCRSLILILSFSLLAFAYHPEYSLISTKNGSKKFITPTSQNAAVKESLSSDRLRAEIARFEKKTGGSVGVGAVHLESGRSFYHNKDIRYPMASTFKIPIAVKLLSLVEKGEIQLSDMIEIKKSDLHPGSGTLSRLLDDPGVILSVQNLLELMLLISDNSATDICLKYVGGSKSVTQKMREIGIMDMDISRPTYVAIANFLGITSVNEEEPYSDDDVVKELRQLSKEQREQAAESFSKDNRDTSTPLAMAKLLEKIWNKEILSQEISEYLRDIMKRCQTGDARLKGILPSGTTVCHKTGTIGGSTNDVGIIELPGDAGNLITVIFIKEAQVDNEQSEKVIAQIARTLYDYFLFNTE